ncbi:hypothetical protein Hanom_Chr02g00157521 [Helianthus anomalus]
MRREGSGEKDWDEVGVGRKLSALAGYCVLFMLQVIGVYWWYQNDDICNPSFMIPPKAIPPFWNAVFTIIVNGAVA